MKKQQFSLSFALGLTLFGCLVGAPMRANAGGAPITGIIPSLLQTIGTIRSNLNTTVQGSVTQNNGGSVNNNLSIQTQTQNTLNQTANTILQQFNLNILSPVIQNKSLVENGESPIVDINMLNAAIIDYNNIVMESSPEELRTLAKDPEFISKGQMLKELRAALNKN